MQSSIIYLFLFILIASACSEEPQKEVRPISETQNKLSQNPDDSISKNDTSFYKNGKSYETEYGWVDEMMLNGYEVKLIQIDTDQVYHEIDLIEVKTPEKKTYTIEPKGLNPLKSVPHYCNDEYLLLQTGCGSPCWYCTVFFAKGKASKKYDFCFEYGNEYDIIVYRDFESSDKSLDIENLDNGKKQQIELVGCDYPDKNGFTTELFDSIKINDQELSIYYQKKGETQSILLDTKTLEPLN